MEESAPRILIVDDDADFASLLSDVFVQASYEVDTVNDSSKVEGLVSSTEFSLVVTDLRMPGIDGLELSRKIRAIQPGLPIIVVSGFLDAKMREKMEAEGVVGLYEKPLSVFSLLKNAARLIAEKKSAPGESEDDEENAPRDSSELGFPFEALPCESDESRAFAESLYRLRNRRTNLCVISPRGIPARAIATEFCGWISSETSSGRILEPKECSESTLASIVEDAAARNLQSLVLCVTEVEQLDPSQQKQLARATRKGAVRDRWEGNLRFLFFISADVESLYQQGALSDELYLSMGGAELAVPPLKDCPEDVCALARSTRDESGAPLEWEGDALRALAEREWPGNHAELRKVLLRLQQRGSSKKLTATDVIAAASEEETPSAGSNRIARRSLRETLVECRSSYLEALHDLLGGDAAAVAATASVPQRMVESVVGGASAPARAGAPGNVRARRRD